jgi:hypothetical protein
VPCPSLNCNPTCCACSRRDGVPIAILRGVAINREGPRFSGDIDIFQDSEHRLVSAAEADAKVLVGAGHTLSWGKIQSGKRQAQVEGLGETMQLEWVADSAFRFFPAQRDELFGYVLHPVDLATNKALQRVAFYYRFCFLRHHSCSKIKGLQRFLTRRNSF